MTKKENKALDVISKKPSVVRSNVKKKGTYSAYKEELRVDFYFSCAYCTITEVEAIAVGFQIDHYFPEHYFPEHRNEYSNLMWSCQYCNRRKDKYFPNEIQKSKGYYVLRPDEHIVEDHIDIDESYKPVAKTETGNFNISMFDLDRGALLKIRELRSRNWDSSEYIRQGMSALAKISVDQIPTKNKAKFLKYSQLFEDLDRRLDMQMKTFIRKIASSHLLDEDPDKQTRAKNRKLFLNHIKAIQSEED